MTESTSLRKQNVSPAEERRKMPDPSAMAVQLDRIQTDVDSLHKHLEKLANSVSQLAVFEAKQAHLHEENQRALNRIEALDACGKKQHEDIFRRLRDLESQMMMNTKASADSSRWINHALTALAGAALVYLGVETGFILS